MSHEQSHPHHIVPLKIYLAVGAALLILTAVTVAVSFIDLGGLNIVVALAVAAVKASLVILFFMHLKYDNKLYMIIFLVAIVFLAIFITFTMFDTLDRGVINPEMDLHINPRAKIYQNMPMDTAAVSSDTLPPPASGH